MVKPEMKFENGKIVVSVSAQLDTDKDGVPSAETSLVQKIDLAEAVNEAFKTDAQWVIDLVGKLGILK